MRERELCNISTRPRVFFFTCARAYKRERERERKRRGEGGGGGEWGSSKVSWISTETERNQ